jgi:nitric-oxide synthase
MHTLKFSTFKNSKSVNLLYENACEFLSLFYKESNLPHLKERLMEVADEINESGTYTQTIDEIEFGVSVAWRNSNRCIGRLFWKSIKIVDCRKVKTVDEIKKAVFNHLEMAYGNGKIKPFLTLFAPENKNGFAPLRIWNNQLIRYAAYRSEGKILGDPAQLEFTDKCLELGWNGRGTEFDVLPIVFQFEGENPAFFEIPSRFIKEIPISHPDLPWFSPLGLKWNALPVISDMVLEMGGIYYPAAPFNGWYMVTEIGARNLGDINRYNKLPLIAEKMGLNIGGKDLFWKDRAMLELNYAVKYSFEKAGVSLTDHHEASMQFMKFIAQENKLGREVMADWVWIVPPVSGSTLEVFHTNFENKVLSPNFYYNTPAWKKVDIQTSKKCPFHIFSKK